MNTYFEENIFLFHAVHGIYECYGSEFKGSAAGCGDYSLYCDFEDARQPEVLIASCIGHSCNDYNFTRGAKTEIYEYGGRQDFLVATSGNDTAFDSRHGSFSSTWVWVSFSFKRSAGAA